MLFLLYFRFSIQIGQIKFRYETFTRCLKLLRIPRPRTIVDAGVQLTPFLARPSRRNSDVSCSYSSSSLPQDKYLNSFPPRRKSTGQLVSSILDHSTATRKRHADSISLHNNNNTESTTAASSRNPTESTPNPSFVATTHPDGGSAPVAENPCPGDGSGSTITATDQPQGRAPAKTTTVSDVSMAVAPVVAINLPGESADATNPAGDSGGEVAVALAVEPAEGSSAVTTGTAIDTATVSSRRCKVDAAANISTTSKLCPQKPMPTLLPVQLALLLLLLTSQLPALWCRIPSHDSQLPPTSLSCWKALRTVKIRSTCSRIAPISTPSNLSVSRTWAHSQKVFCVTPPAIRYHARAAKH